jgi:hypothetical protein
MTTDHDSLSPEGARRAQAILELANQALEERVRVRRGRRAVRAGLGLALVAAAIAPFALRPARPTSTPPTPVAATPSVIERLSDDALLDELAKLGIDAGLIDVAGAVRVVRSDGSPLEFPAPVPPTSS